MKQRSKSSRRVSAEPLEDRRLLSGTWSTVDTMPAQFEAGVSAMAADTSGNVYAVGYTTDSNLNTTLYLRKKTAGSAAWATVTTMNARQWNGVAVDAAGDVFISGENNSSYFATWELVKGTTTLKQIDADSVAVGIGEAVTTDQSGNVYAVGFDRTKYKGGTALKWTVRKGTFANGKWSFSTVDQQLQSAGKAFGVAVAPSGVYVVGYYNNNWTIRKSATGASGTWTTVDSFSDVGYEAQGVATDEAGDIYAVGSLLASNNSNWIVRASTNGGTTWTTVDDFVMASSDATAITRDASGNMVVAGNAYDNVADYVVVRTNAGGSWTTLDQYSDPVGGPRYFAVAADSFGNLYGGGDNRYGDNSDDWMIRSQPAAPTNLMAAADVANPTSQMDLTWANAAGGDETGFAVYRSLDGVTFTQVATLGADATACSDTGLSAGTTYFYYVVSLLNATGMSTASNQAAATTST